MDALTTYVFYKESYYGDSIAESSFAKYLSKATDKLAFFCGQEIDEDVIAKYSVKVQKAVCSLMDLIYKIETAQANANDVKNGNIKSMSSGGQSVTFGNNETIITKVMSDAVAQNRLMFDAISEYLGDTELLYKGI